MSVDRKHWLRHVKEVVRSRHYTWLPRGLGGEKVGLAMTYLLTDIMHICKLSGASFDALLADARSKFDAEEAAEHPYGKPAVLPMALHPDAVDAVVAAFQTADPFEAEMMRARFEDEDIECRVDSQLQGGLKGKVDAKVIVRSKDAEQAAKIIQQVQDATTDFEA